MDSALKGPLGGNLPMVLKVLIHSPTIEVHPQVPLSTKFSIAEVNKVWREVISRSLDQDIVQFDVIDDDIHFV